MFSVSFVGEKRELVKSIGFGGLMSMHKQPQISRSLAFWLRSNFDVVTNTITLRRGVKLKISEYDVHHLGRKMLSLAQSYLFLVHMML